MAKTLRNVVIAVLLVVVLMVVALMINHNNQLRKEAEEHQPPGRLVEVNDKTMHVYGEGKGDMTLVFMAGHGTSNPVLDFKPLWSKLSDEYRITVVEKSGYGWSDASNSPRDLDTMLEETREALQLSGEKGPYVLFPHSMSGLEALYWIQKYPDEVEAIIGLDPVTPENVKPIGKLQNAQLYVMYFLARTGLTRFMESEIGENLPLMNSTELSVEDKEQYMAVFYRSAFSKDMLREVGYLEGNAKTVAENNVPLDTPMYFFISDGQEVAAPGWNKTLSDYISQITTGKSMQLEGGHYLHYEHSEIIAEEAKEFIKDITAKIERVE